MKKLSYFFILLCFLIVGCASKTANEAIVSNYERPSNPNPRNFVLYTPTHEEIGMHLNTLKYLLDIERGNVEISDEELSEILFKWTGNDDMTSMMTEAFLLNSENRLLLTRMFNLIAKNTSEGNSMNAFETAISRKAFASPEKTTDSEGHETLRYVFMDSFYDENINLANFTEYHPFDDEFGVCIPFNDYQVAYVNDENGADSKNLWFIYGGGTNCLTIHIKETEGVKSDRNSILEAMNASYNESKFPDTWEMFDLPLENCLSNSGVDRYFIGYGVGPELAVPEIDCCTFGAYLYRENTQKLYTIEYSLNFSKINLDYEVRDRLYNFMGFYSLLSWCD